MYNEYLKKININLLKNSNKELIISTSGTTGKKKSIAQPNGKIKIANKIIVSLKTLKVISMAAAEFKLKSFILR